MRARARSSTASVAGRCSVALLGIVGAPHGLAWADPPADRPPALRWSSGESPGGLTAATPPPPVERSWSYLDEPQLPSPLVGVVSSRFTYAHSGTSPTRPFASNLAAPGGMFELGGELGIAPRLSLVASGVVGESAGEGTTASPGGTAGIRVSVLPSSWHTTRLVLAGGYLRELSGNNGAWIRATGSQDWGRARVAAAVHGERVFAADRDKIDVMVNAGVSYRFVGALRAGVEYVGQDLEELFADAAEGGARQFVGPTVSYALFDQRLTVVGGPAVGLSSASPKILGRVGVAYQF